MTQPTPPRSSAHCPTCDRLIALRDGVYRKHPAKDFQTSCPTSGSTPVDPDPIAEG